MEDGIRTLIASLTAEKSAHMTGVPHAGLDDVLDFVPFCRGQGVLINEEK